jgi:hypothetical protein
MDIKTSQDRERQINDKVLPHCGVGLTVVCTLQMEHCGALPLALLLALWEGKERADQHDGGAILAFGGYGQATRRQ